jgi:hypothetical protein
MGFLLPFQPLALYAGLNPTTSLASNFELDFIRRINENAVTSGAHPK